MDKPYDIRTAKLLDVLMIHNNLRDEDYFEICQSTPDTLSALVSSFKESEVCLVATHGGVPMVLFGVGTDEVNPGYGMPWMVAVRDWTKVGRKNFLQVSRKFIRECANHYSVLHNYVSPENTQAIRWLQWLGFTITEDPHPEYPGLVRFYLNTEEVLQ